MAKLIVYLLTSLIIIHFPLSQKYEKVKVVQTDLIASSSTETPLTNVLSLDAEVGASIKIYVADIFTSSVIEMSLEEKKIIISRKIGRSGKGPGEFQEVSNVQILADGNLLSYDKNLGRVTIYNKVKTDVSNMFNIHITGDSRIFPMKVYSQKKKGIFYAISQRFFRASDDYKDERKVILQHYDPNGFLLTDSILVKRASEALVVRQGDNISVNPNPPFGMKSIFRFNERGEIFYAWTGDRKIQKYSHTGKFQLSTKIPFSTKEITERDLTLAKKNSYQEFQKTLVEEAPKNWPFFNDFLLDDTGRIWVAESVHFSEKRRIWHIFGQEGKLIGKTSLPSRLKIYQIKKNFVFGVLTDMENRPIVQLYRFEEKKLHE